MGAVGRQTRRRRVREGETGSAPCGGCGRQIRLRAARFCSSRLRPNAAAETDGALFVTLFPRGSTCPRSRTVRTSDRRGDTPSDTTDRRVAGTVVASRPSGPSGGHHWLSDWPPGASARPRLRDREDLEGVRRGRRGPRPGPEGRQPSAGWRRRAESRWRTRAGPPPRGRARPIGAASACDPTRGPLVPGRPLSGRSSARRQSLEG